MTNLPVNIDATYDDVGVGVKEHQQHHDVLHALNNSVGQPGGPAGPLTAEGKLPAAQSATSVTVMASLPPDGATDAASLVQAVHDALPATGGKLVFPNTAAIFVVGSVNITKPNVTIEIPAGVTLVRKAGMVAATRGMFMVQGLQPAHFRLTGEGTIDLNRTAYTNGDANSAIYAVRSTHITVDPTLTIAHSSENAVLYRNCAHIEHYGTVDDCHNNGIEFSIAASDGYSGPSPIPVEEWFIVDADISNVNDGSNGAGNGVGVAVAGSSTAENRRPAHFRFNVRGTDNLRDVHFEFNGAGSYAVDVDIDVQSDSVKQGCVGLVNVKLADVDVVALNPGTAGPRLGGADIYGVVVSGTATDAVTVGATVLDSRGSADDYIVNPIRINGGVGVAVKYLHAVIAANATAATPPVALEIASVSSSVQVGPVRATVTNPPAGSIAVRQSAGTVYLSGPFALSGWATNYSLNGNNWWGQQTDVATAGDVILRTNAKGLRSDTADGADSRFVQLNGGGGFSDGRGALVALYGNENAAAGRLDMRAGNVTGAYISMQAIGQEVARLVGQASIADGQTALMIRRNVGGTFTLQQVSMGAVDSGGVGFKLLRVPN